VIFDLRHSCEQKYQRLMFFYYSTDRPIFLPIP